MCRPSQFWRESARKTIRGCVLFCVVHTRYAFLTRTNGREMWRLWRYVTDRFFVFFSRFCYESWLIFISFFFHPSLFIFQLSGQAGVHRCLPFPPAVLAFIFIAHRVHSRFPLLVDSYRFLASSRSRSFRDDKNTHKLHFFLLLGTRRNSNPSPHKLVVSRLTTKPLERPVYTVVLCPSWNFRRDNKSDSKVSRFPKTMLAPGTFSRTILANDSLL